MASSVAIVMDAVNNLSDALSSVITIVGTKLSQRPADRKHPVPDISVHDEAAFVAKLTSEIQPLVPDIQVVIVVDHNYSE